MRVLLRLAALSVLVPSAALAGAQAWPLTASTNYAYDPAGISVSGGVAALIDSGFGTGADGPLTSSGTVDLSTHTSGSRTVADGAAWAVSSTLAPGATSVPLDAYAGGLSAGDELLLLVVSAPGAPADAGTWETVAVSAVSGSAATTAPLTLGYDGTQHAVVAQRVPQYTHVTLTGGTITAGAWDGTTGGIVAFRAAGVLSVDAASSIHADGLGYRGGVGGAPGSGGGGGESFTGIDGDGGAPTTAGVGSGGGGDGPGQNTGAPGGPGGIGAGGGGADGTANSDDGAGGGGGGSHAGGGGGGSGGAGCGGSGSGGVGGAAGTFAGGGGRSSCPGGSGGAAGSAGAAGSLCYQGPSAQPGAAGTGLLGGGGGDSCGNHFGGGGGGGGATYGDADLVQLFFGGGGGGGGGSSFGVAGGAGGAGGGVVLVFAQTASIDGAVRADGAAGGSVSQGNRGGNGGSGAGGSVQVTASTLSLSGLLSAGGAAPVNTSGSVSGGGGGGVGRIRVDTTSVNGVAAGSATFASTIDAFSALPVGSTNGYTATLPSTSAVCSNTVASPAGAFAWSSFTTVETGAVTYTLDAGGGPLYWDGAGWSASTAPTDSNAASVIDANLSAFPGVALSWCAHLSGAAASTLDDVAVVWDDPPTASAGGPYSGDEGAAIAVSAAASTDPEGALVAWDWDCDNDGTYETVAASATTGTCTFPDEGTYSIGLRVTDAAGLTDVSGATVQVANVAPLITSTPPGTATEGGLYSYTPVVVDPGADTFSFAVGTGAPATMTVGAASGVVEWTPTFADTGTVAVTLTVDDGDGGTDSQSWSIVVGFLDGDGDGMPDTWETANGLDPTDPSDATGDPDLDGVDNLGEYLGGTDPNSYDGPGLPVLLDPTGGVEVADARPLLSWTNASDPQNDALTYDLEVYADAALTTLLTSISGVAEAPGTSTARVDLPLPENADAHWRARADDGNVAGAWTAAEAFFVNETNEPPDAVTLLYPVEEVVGVLAPELQWSAGTDVDRDDLGYVVRIWDEGFTTLVTDAALPTGAAPSWEVAPDLAEDTTYGWEVRAIDEHGLEGPWSARSTFFVSSENAPPSAVVWIDPQDDDQVESRSPDLVVTVSLDVEGERVDHVIELDTVDTFDSADFVSGIAVVGDGEAVLSLADEGVELAEDTLWYGRARGEDASGVGSAWAQVRFFVRGDNGAPPVPELLAPDDGAVVDGAPTFVVGHVHDPEGDRVSYELRATVDLDGTEVVATLTDLAPGAGPLGGDAQTSWTPGVDVGAAGFWTARAVDEHGAASDWADPRALTIAGDPVVEPDGPIVTGGPECGCTTALPRSASPAWLLLLVAAARRRR